MKLEKYIKADEAKEIADLQNIKIALEDEETKRVVKEIEKAAYSGSYRLAIVTENSTLISNLKKLGYNLELASPVNNGYIISW